MGLCIEYYGNNMQCCSKVYVKCCIIYSVVYIYVMLHPTEHRDALLELKVLYMSLVDGMTSGVHMYMYICT